MLKTIEDFKGLEGTTIYAKGTGNNSKEGIKPFTVVSVKRKYVELEYKPWNSKKMYLPSSGATQESVTSGYGGNDGWDFYLTEQDINNEIDNMNKLLKIKQLFDPYARYGDLKPEDINVIYTLLIDMGYL